MFVGERMSRPVISVSPDTPINDVLAMFRQEHIRRAPVMKDGKLVVIVSVAAGEFLPSGAFRLYESLA